jgi:NhaP-type Na+/H+ or K+/H+ antiporter
MSTGTILIIICSLIIVAYLLELLAKKLRIPAVLLLIGLGVGVKLITEQLGIITFDFMRVIPTLGTLGLILIVFEGGLELEYSRQKNKTIRNALLLSVLILIATALGIALVFQYFTGASFYHCLVNAIPYSVISSAIAIPSAKSMSKEVQEFITFESSFSDIFGIVFYNYALLYSSLSFAVLGALFLELSGVIILSLVFCVFLLFLLRSITHQVKFVMLISLMVLLYAIGKELHLSSLILVLIFGLLVRNIQLIKWEYIQKRYNAEKFKKDFHLLHSITAEGVFLIKAFFFVIFGFIIDVNLLADSSMLIIAVGTAGVIYLARLVMLPLVLKKVFPELLFSPRGLISILLYLGLPDSMKIPQLHVGLLFFIVLSTSLVMVSAAFFPSKKGES